MKKSFDKIYVLDTNIILNDAHNMEVLSEGGKNLIILPETVIDELDNKKTGFDEINFQAREFGRLLQNAEVLDTHKVGDTKNIMIMEVCIKDIILIHIISFKDYELGVLDHSILNDRKIIKVATFASTYYKNKDNTLLISDDIMCRTRAISLGVNTTGMIGKRPEDYELEFIKEITLDSSYFNTLNNKPITDYDLEYSPENYCYSFLSPDGNSCYGYIVNDRIQTIEDSIWKGMKVKPLNLGQKFAVAGMLDTRFDMIYLNAIAGSGKAQPVSEPILTPYGWSTMGEIRIGDYIIGSNGTAIQVLGEFPQGERDIYKVEFIDGTYTYCDLEHLWTVKSGKNWGTDGYNTLTTREMLNTWISKDNFDKRYNTYQKRYNYAIPINKEGIEYISNVVLPIKPYSLGLLLGDGGFTTDTISFTNKHKHIVDRLNIELNEIGYTFKNRWENGAYRGNIIRTTAPVSFKTVLKDLGLLGKYSYEKSIPEIYMKTSIKDRKELYQGLIDTDGYVINGVLDEFCTTSEKLCDDFLELGRSLGYTLSYTTKNPKYLYKGDMLEGRFAYRVRELRKEFKAITNIEYSHKEEAKCILVDSEDHLYVTRGFNLTHNTLLSLSAGMREVDLGKYDKILYIRNSIESLDKGEEVGFLSGNDEKFRIYNYPLYDSLDFIASVGITKKEKSDNTGEERIEELITKYQIQTLWVGALRGRSLDNAFVIIDEQQNISKKTMQTILTRIGKNCKVILIGSSNQIDNLYINKYTNADSIIREALKEKNEYINIFATKLSKVVRGKLTEFAEKLFTTSLK